MAVVRKGAAGDLEAVAAMQAASPEASQWNPADYLEHDFRVCVEDNQVVAFLVTRNVAHDESEILNLIVSPEFRRKHFARAMLGAFLDTRKGSVYLEVRATNLAARNLYMSMGFKEVNVRLNYYHDPPEAAIVMKFHSC